VSGHELDRWRRAVQRNDRLQEETMTEATQTATPTAVEVVRITTAPAGSAPTVVVIVSIPDDVELAGSTRCVINDAAAAVADRIKTAIAVQLDQEVSE
jgi:hypothetical protein